jgi:hypothetical protein
MKARSENEGTRMTLAGRQGSAFGHRFRVARAGRAGMTLHLINEGWSAACLWICMFWRKADLSMRDAHGVPHRG